MVIRNTFWPFALFHGKFCIPLLGQFVKIGIPILVYCVKKNLATLLAFVFHQAIPFNQAQTERHVTFLID
jgi:hypothetical protein